MSEVFVSYQRENIGAVSRLVEAMRAEGLTVWWDQDIPPNAPWEETIEHQLSVAKVVIVAWSPSAVSSDSVKAEARWARQQGRLLQVFVEACEPPLFFGERQGVDLRTWSGVTSDRSFRLLLESVRDVLAAAPVQAVSNVTAPGGLEPRRSFGRVTPDEAAARKTTSGVLPEGAVLNGLFEVRRLIARGDLAAVYEGVNITTRERVAIKSFHPNIVDSPAVRDSFLREMLALTRLNNPAIANYRMAAREPTLGVLYIVHEFVDGIVLETLIGQVTAPEPKLRGLIRRLAEGLKHAHDLGVLHRMLAPENIIAPGGRLDACVIVDFGLAEHFDALPAPQMAGIRYAAPEQFGDADGEVGPWTDVYSLGLVMLALATGIRPAPVSALSDAEARGRAGADLSKAPRKLRPLFAGMLAPGPKLRFRSMDDVLSALDERPTRGKRLGASSPA
jgi:tRNA A-37 threonylcarbamoyl transferase component Bud32